MPLIKDFQSTDFSLTTSDVDLLVSFPVDISTKKKPVKYLIVTTEEANIGDTVINIEALPIEIPKNTELEINEVLVVVNQDAGVGSQTLVVLPLEDAIAASSQLIINQLFSVFSINQADGDISSQEIESRTFRSGGWSSKQSIALKAGLTLSGVYVKGDPGLKYVRQASIKNKKVWVVLQTSEQQQEGFAYIIDYTEPRLNDNHRKISFNVIFDGQIYDGVDQELITIIHDENGDLLFDEDNNLLYGD